MPDNVSIYRNRLQTMGNTESISDILDSIKSRRDLTGAFDAIIGRYSERLYWHIRRIVVLHEDAEDILQDTFVTAFTNAHGFRGDSEGSLIGWLYKIATNLCIKHLNRRRRWGFFTSADTLSERLSADFEGEISPSADEISVKLQRAVVALPMKQKLVFNMRYYDEMPFEQISKITGQSVSTLKANYHYAVQKVKREVTTIEI